MKFIKKTIGWGILLGIPLSFFVIHGLIFGWLVASFAWGVAIVGTGAIWLAIDWVAS